MTCTVMTAEWVGAHGEKSLLLWHAAASLATPFSFPKANALFEDTPKDRREGAVFPTFETTLCSPHICVVSRGSLRRAHAGVKGKSPFGAARRGHQAHTLTGRCSARACGAIVWIMAARLPETGNK